MDIERTIEFILAQQAQFTTNITQLKDGLSELRDHVSQLTGLVGNLALLQQNSDEIVANLARRVVDLTEAQAKTDERLNALIAIVERHVSNH
jgi:chromosome segregation ATPase